MEAGVVPDDESLEPHAASAVAVAAAPVTEQVALLIELELHRLVQPVDEHLPREARQIRRRRGAVEDHAQCASGQVAQVPYHLNRAMDNGLTQEQAAEP